MLYFFIEIVDLKIKHEELTLKFEESVQALEHLKTKYNNLEEEYEEHKNTAASSAEGVIDLKEKLDAVSQQLGKFYYLPSVLNSFEAILECF